MNERWEFMQAWKQALEMVIYKVTVDGQDYCTIGFPEEDSYATVIETCKDLVESDKKFAGKVVRHTYVNTEKALVSFHTTTYNRDDGWFTL